MIVRPRAHAWKRHFDVHCAGFCEPDPGGLATFGYVIMSPGAPLETGAGVVGRGPSLTTTVAEYAAIVHALEDLRARHGTAHKVTLCVESRFIVEQLTTRTRAKRTPRPDLHQAARSLVHTLNAEVVYGSRKDNPLAEMWARIEFQRASEAEAFSAAQCVLRDIHPLASPGTYTVSDRYLVDLTLGVCSCREFLKRTLADAQFRCSHLIAAAMVAANPPASG